MLTSKRTPWYLGLVWFCMHGIQFPTDPMKDHFLSSLVCVRTISIDVKLVPTCTSGFPLFEILRLAFSSFQQGSAA